LPVKFVWSAGIWTMILCYTSWVLHIYLYACWVCLQYLKLTCLYKVFHGYSYMEFCTFIKLLHICIVHRLWCSPSLNFILSFSLIYYYLSSYWYVLYSSYSCALYYTQKSRLMLNCKGSMLDTASIWCQKVAHPVHLAMHFQFYDNNEQQQLFLVVHV